MKVLQSLIIALQSDIHLSNSTINLCAKMNISIGWGIAAIFNTSTCIYNAVVASGDINHEMAVVTGGLAVATGLAAIRASFREAMQDVVDQNTPSAPVAQPNSLGRYSAKL